MTDDSKYPSQLAERFQVRMPDGLRDRLREAAEGNKRAMNTEIVARLEDSFAPDSSAELRRRLDAKERYVIALESAGKATNALSDSTRAIAEMYEQQVKELQERLDQIALVSKFVSNSIGDAAEGAPGDLKYLLENLHPFQDEGSPQDPAALLAAQYELGIARCAELPVEDQAAARDRLVSLMQGSAEMLGVEWSPPSCRVEE